MTRLSCGVKLVDWREGVGCSLLKAERNRRLSLKAKPWHSNELHFKDFTLLCESIQFDPNVMRLFCKPFATESTIDKKFKPMDGIGSRPNSCVMRKT